MLLFRSRVVAAICGLVLCGMSYGQESNLSRAIPVQQLQLAAEQGDASAQYDLGVRYYTGNDVAEDHTQAFKWFRSAADQGHAPSQINLSSMYDRGDGVQKNHVESVKWLRLAAEHGDARAQFYLGGNYVNDEDFVEAYKWYKLAAAQGYPQALTYKEYLEDQMTNDQLSEVEAHIEIYCGGFVSGWRFINPYATRPAPDCPNAPQISSNETWNGRGFADGIRNACTIWQEGC